MHDDMTGVDKLGPEETEARPRNPGSGHKNQR